LLEKGDLSTVGCWSSKAPLSGGKEVSRHINEVLAKLPTIPLKYKQKTSGWYLQIDPTKIVWDPSKDAIAASIRARGWRTRLVEHEPGLNESERDLRIRNLLAMPDDVVPPGHMTGGDEKGSRVNVEVSPQQIPRKRQALTFCPGLPNEIAEKRRMLLQSLTQQGFHNYSREYWHYSYGDAYWAVRRRLKIAIYGIPQASAMA
jgi:hypothetical protein